MTFNQWFETATINIAQIETPSLRDELEAHVQEATEAHQQTGISKLAAEEMAVLALGNPKKAARGFERTHLTKEQARRAGLEPTTVPQWAIWAGAIPLIAFNALMMLFPIWISNTYPSLADAFSQFSKMEMAGVATMVLGAWLEQKIFTRRAAVWLLTSVTIFGRGLILACLAIWSMMPHPFQIPVWMAVGFGMLCILAWCLTDLPLLRKLRARA